ncbi:MAG: hypothetical protein Q8R28_12265 [Dehalococcoidia bacterium]|nr:hypothetical protein [Dehalococcoidia bacterium]
MIVKTGIKVSEKERQVALERARGVAQCPVIKVEGVWLPDEMRLEFGDWLDALAQSKGLPAPKRDSDGDVIHYGMTMEGEFTTWTGDPDECADQDVLGT